MPVGSTLSWCSGGSTSRLRGVIDIFKLIHGAFDARSWHGTTLRGSLRGLTASDAVWRPGGGRRNIWELAEHCAYWKYSVRRRLTGIKRGSYPLPGHDWFPTPSPASTVLWKQTVARLGDEHRALREVVSRLPPAALARRSGSTSTAALMRGVAAHDLYHAGQIQLIKRLRRSKAS
jgi:hypothetical protein